MKSENMGRSKRLNATKKIFIEIHQREKKRPKKLQQQQQQKKRKQNRK